MRRAALQRDIEHTEAGLPCNWSAEEWIGIMREQAWRIADEQQDLDADLAVGAQDYV